MQDTSQQIHQVLTRGVVEVLPNKETLSKLMDQRKIKLYLGIDPTGSELHLGHSVALRKLQQFAGLGHQVILLIGNGTVRIGDPTGKDATRPMLTDDEINENFKNWKKQASKVLDFDKIEIVHNGDWLDKLDMTQIIKLLAKTTVQQLIERDMFQERIKKGLPIYGHEILYPMLQGYDSVEMDVDLEIGGTDQTFNMMMGRTLQKIYNNKEKWVLTTPLINGTDGRKMSKSYNNYVALTENPIDMYGQLMRINDEIIIEYLTLLTDMPLEEIEEMKQAMVSGANPMEFKKKLAFVITEQYHSAEDAVKAADHFQKTVQEKAQADNIPEKIIDWNTPKNSLATLSVLFPDESKNNLRRLIEQGGTAILSQNVKITDPDQELRLEDGDVVRIGKRRQVKVKFTK